MARHLKSVFQAFGREPVYRVLLTRVQPIASHAQVHACTEVRRLKLPCFETALQHRAAYVEIGLSGRPPHLSDLARSTVSKAVAEIDALVAEVSEIVGLRAAQRQKGVA